MNEKYTRQIIKVVQGGIYAAVETFDEKGLPISTRLFHYTELPEDLVDTFNATRIVH